MKDGIFVALVKDCEILRKFSQQSNGKLAKHLKIQGIFLGNIIYFRKELKTYLEFSLHRGGLSHVSKKHFLHLT